MSTYQLKLVAGVADKVYSHNYTQISITFKLIIIMLLKLFGYYNRFIS